MIVSFIIRTKNEEQDIVHTLKCLRKQEIDGYELEIILVDSGSTDKTIEYATPLIDKLVQISSNDFTWGRAINVGVREAAGDIIGLISGHCFMEENTSLVQGIECLIKHDIVALYGQQIGDPRKDPFEYIELEELYPTKSYKEAPAEVIAFSNACCLIKREMLEVLSFDEDLQSAEDVYWANDMLIKGYKLGYSSNLKVIHGHQINADYLYRKTFWKVYRDQTRLGRSPGGVRGSKIYLFITNIIGRTVTNSIKFSLKLRKHRIKRKSISSLRYSLIISTAHYSAKYCFNKCIASELKYEDIQTPRFIKSIK